MNRKYMIDTSVWVDYLKDSFKELNDFIDHLIDNDEVYINGIIQTELLVGTKNRKEYDLLKNNLECFHWVNMDEQTFEKTSLAGFQLRRKGITVPLSDLIIAAHCSQHGFTLIEKDKHFHKIKEVLNISIHNISS